MRAILVGVIVLAAVAFQTVAQQDCPRGSLDNRFCDEDGDLVADAPADPKQWVDSGTLIFAYTPVEDPEVYRHDVGLAQLFAMRIVGLRQGEIVYDGPPSDLTPEGLTAIYGEEDRLQTIR